METEAALSPREVAQRLRERGIAVHPSSIRNWIAAGHIPGAMRTPGGYFLIPPDAVARIVQRLEPPPTLLAAEDEKSPNDLVAV